MKYETLKEQLRKSLPTRIKRTENMANGACYLDLRAAAYGNMGRVVLHDPSHPMWPREGNTTKSISVAAKWVSSSYAEWLAIELTARAEAVRAGDEVETLTVEEACSRYLMHIARKKDVEHHTVTSRESQVRLHIVPKFGARAMTSLTKREVRDWLNGLMVEKAAKGGVVKVEAAMNSKRSLRTTLLAIWRHNHPDVDPPFAGIWLDDRDNKPLHEQIIADEDMLKQLLQPVSGALTMEQLTALLVAAAWYDQQVLSRPNMLAISIPNTAFAIAFYCATGCRLEEGLRGRWFMINEAKGYLVINSVKNAKTPLRIVPLQNSLLPWLEEARREQERRLPSVGSRDHIIQTKPKCGGVERSTLEKRVASVFRFANLKRPKKAVHGLRATYATLLANRQDVLSAEQLKRYLGHTVAYAGATDLYVAQLDQPMPHSHRDLIELPTPEEVRAAAASFIPENRPYWRESWRRPETRDPEVRARQAAKKQERLARLRANY